MSVSIPGVCPGESLSVSRALNVIVIPGRSPLKCSVPPIEIAGMAVVVALSPGADIVVEAPPVTVIPFTTIGELPAGLLITIERISLPSRSSKSAISKEVRSSVVSSSIVSVASFVSLVHNSSTGSVTARTSTFTARFEVAPVTERSLFPLSSVS